MAYSSAGFTDTQDNQKSFNEKYVDNDPGPYIGTVKVTVDPLKMGRLGVNIPALSLTTNPTASQIIWCQYLSPFYGAKSIKAVSEINPYLYKETQHSYGMWAVPPDVDTDVLVMFAKGEQSNASAFWIGCVQKPLVNQQVPGNGATANTSKAAEATEFSETSKLQTYGTEFLPAGEKNQRLYAPGEVLQNIDKWKYPVNDVLADQLEKQGLVQDTVRGTTSSSARRESPSRVFGINTPGRIRSDSRELNIGLDNSKVKTDRDPGHSFVMDDGAADGTNQLTRLRTASGHQLLMHDTEGVVYIANGSGKAFIEMNADGKVSIYATDGISMRTEGDFNLHSDRNIQLHAKKKIKFTAEEDVVLNAEKYIYAMGQSGILNASHKGSVRHYAKDGITSFTDGPQLHGASGRIDLAGSQVHFNSVPARATWGPSWMQPDHDKIQIIAKEGEIDIDAYAPLEEGKPGKIENKTTVRDTSIGRGDFVNDIDPLYSQPDIGETTGSGYKGMQFDNAWEELEAMVGPNGDGKTAEGTFETLTDSALDSRQRILLNELGVVTPFMDKKNGVGNMKEKKAQFYKKLKERQKVGLPDAVGGVFVTHEPWSRGVKPVKRIKDPQYDPYYKGRFSNEWLEWENLDVRGANSPEEEARYKFLIEKLGIAQFSETGNYGSNVAEAKAKYYADLKKRQNTYEDLSASEQSEIINQNN
jgi:uncharacterized protein (DUF2345 family)